MRCIHCYGIGDEDHSKACPFTTNCWPVTGQDLSNGGMMCPICSDVLEIGDFYSLIPGEHCEVIVCIVCAILQKEVSL